MAIFISYSRKDVAFVRRLHQALAARRRETWVDWEGIAPSADWFREIEAAIDGADAFAFVLGPDSLASAVCARELAHAVAQNKRVLPIVHHDVAGVPVPPVLARLNWIFLRDSDDFDAALDVLLAAVDTDLDWVHAHSRLLMRAGEWEAQGHNASLTLRGADLQAAERWLALGPTKTPPPTAAQTRFVIDSRRQATKRRFQALGALATALVVIAVFGTLSVFERRQAARQQTISVARRLAATAERLRDQVPADRMKTTPQERSLQLAAEAVRRLDALGERSLDADLALRRALALLPQRIASLPDPAAVTKLDALTFTADGGLATVSSSPLHSTVWVGPGRERAATPDSVAGRRNAVLAADGRWLVAVFSAVTGGDTLEVRNAETLAPVAQFAGFANVVDLALGPGGTLVASLSADPAPPETRVWQLPARAPIARLPLVYAPSISLDGRHLAGIVDDKVVVWSIERLRTGDASALATLDTVEPHGVQFSTDGSRLVVRSGDAPERVSVWALGDRTAESEVRRDGFIAAGPAARQLLVRGPGVFALSVIDGRSGREIARLASGTAEAAAAWSRDGQLLAVENQQAVDLWRPMPHGSAGGGVDVGPGIFAVAFDPGDARLAVLARHGEGAAAHLVASTWDMASSRRIGEVDLGVVAGPAVFSADGRRIVFGAPGGVRVVSAADGRVVHDSAVPGTATAVALSANGTFLAAQGDDGTLSTWRLDPPRALLSAAPASQAVRGLLAIGADGAQVTAIAANASRRIDKALSVRRWRVDGVARDAVVQAASASAIEQETSGFAASVCALSAGGETMAAMTSNTALHVRDTRSGRDLAVVDDAGGSEAVCAFSADGRWFATGGADGGLRLWDLATGEEAARMEVPAAIRAITFGPGARHVAALGDDGVLRHWPLRYADLLAQACARLSSNMTRSDWQRFAPAEPYRPTCAVLPVAPEEQR